MSITKIFENTGASLNDILKFIFKEFASKLAEILTYICIKSLTSFSYQRPDFARITCILKSGNGNSASSYRLFVLSPFFSKILDKIVECPLLNYLTSHELLNPKKFGSRRGNFTEHTLHSIIKAKHSSFNNGMYSMGMFLDIKKNIWLTRQEYSILLKKLMYYGIKGF